jgi:hypothetical protein
VFNAIFNAMRTLPDLTRIYLYQSFIKTAINTAITVKLLTSKVTLLNTCEKLKMQPRPQGLPRGGARAEEDPGKINTAEKRLRMHQIMKIWRGI